MLRRGITYGPPFDPATAQADRGLLFLAYMTSFDGQFLILNTDRMNNAGAPEVLAGHDMLVGQSNAAAGRWCKIPGPAGQVSLSTTDRWVVPTGGAFLFAPSLSAIQNL